MSSDPADATGTPGAPDGTAAGEGPAAGPAALARLLGEVTGGEPPGSVELAELLWLAGHAEGDSAPVRAPRPQSAGREPSGTPATPGAPPPAGPPPPAPPAGPGAEPPAGPGHSEDRVPLLLPGSGDAAGSGGPGDDDGPHTTLLAPAPPMLAHPLALQRTLRPLKRRVPAPVGQELDEEETAHRIARLGAAPPWWMPVLRPATERWLTLHLVHDTGPTMPVWRPLVRELHTALAQSGVFRTVELHRLTAGGTVRRPGSQEAYADGRTVTLLVSDCMGPQWRGGPPGNRWYRTLRRWAARMPVAVLQPLPERLWRTTALPATAARISAPWPAAPNSAYSVDSYAVADPHGSAPLPLPVLEPSAPWLANWSALVAGSGQLPGSVALLDAAPPPAPLDEQGRGDVEQLSPEELVLRFRSIASPEAFRLAGHLAVGRAELPVMRLVQAAIEPSPQPQHLAEVILSGVLSSTPGPPGSYAFRPGVRELLLGTLPRTAHTRTAELLSRVGALIDVRAGVAAGEFPVLAPGRGDERGGGEPIATVREESLRRLGGATPARSGGLALGRYRLVRRLGTSGGHALWQALDTEADRTVTVHQYPAPPARHQLFLERARALAGVGHAHVIAVRDYGIDDGLPCLVTEFVEGLTVAELTAEGGFGLPFSLLAPLAQQVADGLRAAHEKGVAHGRLTSNALLVAPDGTVKITHFALDAEQPPDQSQDLSRFGHLLRRLAGGDSAPELGAIPGEFRAFFDDALTPLTSSDLEAQRRGRDLFLTPSFAQVLQAGEASRFRFRLLGPVRVSQGSRPLAAGAPREQALLCMLLLRRARTVTHEELIQGLWGRRRPQRAARLLSTYAAGLRKTLGPGVLATTADGYALLADPGGVDLNRCEELIARSKALRDEQNPAGARAAVREALALWQGQPVDGVPGPAAETTRGRLRALRLTLCATRAELDLELGRFERAAADLTELLRSHPRREDFRRLHILALKGQGRIAEAIESYEAFEEASEPYGEPSATMLELYRELRGAPERARPTIVVEYLDPGEQALQPRSHSAVGRTLAWLLSLSDMAPRDYELLARDNGYLVITEPEASVLTALHAVMRELPGALLEMEDPPRLSVTFWHTAQFTPADRAATLTAEVGSGRDVVIVLSPPLHEELMGGGTAVTDASFLPLRWEGSGPPVAWYCPLDLPERAPAPAERDLVRGPFTKREIERIRVPDQGRVAVVHTEPDGSLTLLDPGRPLGKRPQRYLITYYEVDLTTHGATHELHLPSSGRGAFAASAELSWHVDDPVAFVRSETTDVSGLLLDHLVREAGRITRRHPLTRAGAAQRAVHDGLRRWPVPGLSVGCSVRLRPGAPASQVPPPEPAEHPVERTAPHGRAGRHPADSLLGDAACVLLGFHGTLARLWGGVQRDAVNRELAALLVDLRSPDDALSGTSLPGEGAPTPPLEGHADPYDLLRAFADHRSGPELRRRLDRLEAAAAASASPVPYADSLVRALAATGRGPAVVTNASRRAVLSYLTSRGLADSVTGGVHGRSDDLTLLMPDPDCLRRALDELGVAAREALLIGSTVAELTAANAVGLPFVGLTRQTGVERRLTRAGCEHIITSLEPVLDAVRAD
ncbi:SAV_2336 N-terminal domain-related protein [Streptomyces sp. Tue6028]|uniref:SAV_2336 N-terminal domain-related protein n=1 Tax=Streptomyces sp. Tue6028 TaxID=2036037 RepID=UPI003D73BFB6